MKLYIRLLSAAALAGFVSLASAEAKIGVVNTDLLLQNSPQYRAAQESIGAEFSPRQLEIQALQQQASSREEKLRKDAATMTELQRAQADRELKESARNLQQKTTAFEEDFNSRKEEEMNKLQRTLGEEVAAFAKANNYDIILVGGVGYATAAYDVTSQLLDSLRKKAGVLAPAAAPAKPAAGAGAGTGAKPAAPAPAKPGATKPASP